MTKLSDVAAKGLFGGNAFVLGAFSKGDVAKFHATAKSKAARVAVANLRILLASDGGAGKNGHTFGRSVTRAS